MNKKQISIAQYVIFIALGVFLSCWSLKNLDHVKINQIKFALLRSRYLLIVPILLVFILSHLVRALRWKLLINSLGYNPRTDNTFYAVMVGYLTNMAVPRLGEILKCTLLSRYEKLPLDKLFGTIILERIIDGVSLIFILALTIAVQPDIYANLIRTLFHVSDNHDQNEMSFFVIAAILISITILGIFLWMLIKKKTFFEILVTSKQIIKRVWEGVSAIRHLEKRRLFLIYTFSLWLLYFLGGYIALFALKETQQYGLRQALTILTAGCVGMILTPGGIGAFALLIKNAMQLYGLDEGIALAIGWILWFIDVFVVILLGVFSFAAFPYFNSRRKISASPVVK